MNAYSRKKWGNIWRTSHSYTSLILHFHVMYFNVWINSHVKLGSSSWVLVSTTDFNQTVQPYYVLGFIVSETETSFKTGNMFGSKATRKKHCCECIDPHSPLLTLPAPVPTPVLHLAHFGLDSSPPSVLGKRHPTHFTTPELLEIAVKMGEDCNKTYMNSFTINY